MASRYLIKLLTIILLFCLTACGVSPQVLAQQRLFLDLSLEFIGEYQLPKTTFKKTKVGGLSGITYDAKKNVFYAISDDRSRFAPARFYTLKINTKPQIKVEIQEVTFLKNESGETFPQDTIDGEGIALSPQGTLFISSEGNYPSGRQPFIREFDLTTGKQKQNLRIPDRYLIDEQKTKGIQENLAFEALAIDTSSAAPGDPYRLFTATESALKQDLEPNNSQANSRFLHYLIDSIGGPGLVAEHAYQLEANESDTLNNGLTDLTVLPQKNTLLALERTLNLSGFGAKIFQISTSNSTDTSRLIALQENNQQVRPLRKKLLLDLNELNLELDNLEGITLGPRLPDGSQSLLLVSDDNFREEQVSQFLLFRLKSKK